MRPRRFNAKRACIEQLEREGWLAHDVERHTKFGTLDFLGVFDVIAWDPKQPAAWIGVQVTTGKNRQVHMDKMMASEKMRTHWLACGFGAELWLYPDHAAREEGDTEPDRIRIR